MKLVTNQNVGHRAAIRAVLERSTEVFVAVAFLKRAGATLLTEALGPRLQEGGRAQIFIGTDFFLTEPNALGHLLEFASAPERVEVRIASRAAATFHPKTYAGFAPEGLRCLIGSANLTGGALGSNFETSILIETRADEAFAAQVREMFQELHASERFRPLDALELAAYRSAWRPVNKARSRLDEAIDRVDLGTFDLALLAHYRAEYLGEPANRIELARRQANRRLARRVQSEIAALGDGGRGRSDRKRKLEGHLQDLMSSRDRARHLWPSGDIHRRGGGVLTRPTQTIAMFRRAQEVRNFDVEEGYAALRDIALNLPGAGINMITEMLSTYAPRHFAVVNGNTVTALKHLGLTFSGSSSLGLEHVRPSRYAEIVSLIAAVRDRIGAADYPETDAFLNWIYQTKA